METNGQSESRLDQLERLTTQYSIENHNARADLAMLETTEKLKALIKRVDGNIGRNN